MLWLSRKDIEHISRRLLRDYLKKVPQKVDHIDPADFAEKMCGLQFTFADISEAHDAIGLTATSGVIITIPQRDGTRLDYNNEQAKANQRIMDAAQTLKNASPHITEWDESAVRQLVETVKILSKDEVAVTLKGGIEICQKIMY